MTNVGDALSTLTNALSEREKDLEAREEKLKQLQARSKNERSNPYSGASPSDVLHLNIGGTSIALLRRTLTFFPDSMLGSKFSGRWDDSIEKDEHGHFFIDQEYSLFIYIIRYLRHLANGAELKTPDLDALCSHEGRNATEELNQMVEYYGLTNAFYPTKLTACLRLDPIDELGLKQANTEKWNSFLLALNGHKKRVKTYEVTLGTVKRVQIGWYSQYMNFEVSPDSGVGDLPGTFALDLTRSSFLVNGQSTHIDQIEHSEGTVVRSEDYGKVWYVDGNLVAPVSKDKWYDQNYYGSFSPCISIRGAFEVTLVELDI